MYNSNKNIIQNQKDIKVTQIKIRIIIKIKKIIIQHKKDIKRYNQGINK